MKKVFSKLKIDSIKFEYVVLVIALIAGFVSASTITINFTSLNKIFRYTLFTLLTIHLSLDLIKGKMNVKPVAYVIFVACGLYALITKITGLLMLILLCAEFRNIKFSKLISIALTVFEIMLPLVIFCSVFDFIPNWYVLRGTKMRYTLGFCFPLVTINFFMFLVLMRLYLAKTKISYSELLMMATTALLLFFITDARLDFYIIMFILAFMVVAKNVKSEKWKNLFSNKAVKVLLISLPFILLLGSCLISFIYIKHPNSALFVKLDSALSARLSFTAKIFKEYSFSFFGTKLPSGGTEIIGNLISRDSTFVYLDNSFLNLSFTYGFMAVIIFTCASYCIYHALKEKDYALLFIFLVISFASLLENILLYTSVNIFVYYFATCIIKNKKFKEVVEMQNNENPNICAVVVSYNRKELLKESIQALINQNYKNLQVLVVDNASTDGTHEYISSLIDNTKVKYFNTGSNLGGAGGFNFGIKKALEQNADYVWLMDDDCIVKPDSLTKLLDFAKNVDYNFGYLSSKVLWKDGSLCNMNKQRTSLSSEIKNFDKSCEIMLASFVSFFIKSSVVEEVGLPIKDFFIWGDDWEYTSRISKNYHCYYVCDSVVVHKCQKNIGADIVSDNNERLDRYFYAYRNEGYFYNNNSLYGKLYFKLKVAYHKLKIKLKKQQNKKQKLEIINKGLTALKTFKPKIEFAFRPNRKINVLEFFGEPLSYGGQEAFVVNMCKNFENPNVNYTFFTPFNSENTNLNEFAQKNNQPIIACNKNFNTKLRKFYIGSTFKKYLKTTNSHFNVIHIHSGSVWTLFKVAKIAKKYGIDRVFVHSHCTGKNTLKYKLIKHFSDKSICKYADEFMACSDLAAQWKFPKQIVEQNNFIIMKNGIETNKFLFNQKIRDEYRKEFNLGNNLTICHVGRFGEEKNHQFIVDLSMALKNKLNNFKIILVGDGPLKQSIIDKTKACGVYDNFIFLEKRTDVYKILMASDVFILPSIFEGLGIVAIEAQASGLPTICSTNVPNEANLTNLFKHLELTDVGTWVDAILNAKVENRTAYPKLVAQAGYDAKQSATQLENLYLGKNFED